MIIGKFWIRAFVLFIIFYFIFGDFAFTVWLVTLAIYFLSSNLSNQSSRTRVRKQSSLRKIDTSIYSGMDNPIYKGREGEKIIFSELVDLEFPKEFIQNIMIKDEAQSTEIDLIMIAESGIYVFEIKNYSGWIFGNEKQKNWTQTFPNKTKHQFYNPIIQNVGHIKALKKLLNDAYNGDYYSVIVFTDTATLKTVPESTNHLMILNEANIADIIRSSVEFNTKIKGSRTLDINTIAHLRDFIQNSNQHNLENFDAHIAYARSKA